MAYCAQGHETADPSDCLSCALGMPAEPRERRKSLFDAFDRPKRQARKDCSQGLHRIPIDAKDCHHCLRMDARRCAVDGPPRSPVAATKPDPAKLAANQANKAEFRARAWPGGRIPNVMEIPVVADGTVERFVMCPRGMIPHSMRSRLKRRRR